MKSKTLLKRVVEKKHIVLTENAEQSISVICDLLKKINTQRVLVQDQGSWLNCIIYSRRNGIVPIELPTNYGIIDPESIEKKANDSTALFVSSLSGYYAEQQMHKIQKICKKCSVILINDISGSIGTENAKVGDLLFASFGKYKPVNLGYGGMIATSNKSLFKSMKGYSFEKKKEDALVRELNLLQKRVEALKQESLKIKKEFKNYDILHKKNKGINVIVKCRNEQEKKEIIKQCNVKGYPYKECPRYIRVNENAISIEVKQMPVLRKILYDKKIKEK